jgi:hypothetical protein
MASDDKAGYIVVRDLDMCREKRLEYMVERITGIDIDGVLQGWA